MSNLRYKEILEEINLSLSKSNLSQLEDFIGCILQTRYSICYGAGRVGLSMRGFAKRLRHLGLESFYLEDTTVPATNSHDLFIIGSGSGETPTVRAAAQVAYDRGLNLILITTNPESSIAQLSKHVLVIESPSKVGNSQLTSIQPMTTLFEQSLSILLDSIVLRLMQKVGQDEESMRVRHNVIE